MLRWFVLGCFIIGLAGCGGNEGISNSGGVNSSFGKSTPTYEWKRPSSDVKQRPAPPAEAGDTDPF